MFSPIDVELIMDFLDLIKNQDTQKLEKLEKLLSASDKEIHKLDDLLTFIPMSDMLHAVSR